MIVPSKHSVSMPDCMHCVTSACVVLVSSDLVRTQARGLAIQKQQVLSLSNALADLATQLGSLNWPAAGRGTASTVSGAVTSSSHKPTEHVSIMPNAEHSDASWDSKASNSNGYDNRVSHADIELQQPSRHNRDNGNDAGASSPRASQKFAPKPPSSPRTYAMSAVGPSSPKSSSQHSGHDSGSHAPSRPVPTPPKSPRPARYE